MLPAFLKIFLALVGANSIMNPEQIMNIPKMIMIHFAIIIIKNSCSLRIKDSAFQKNLINNHRTYSQITAAINTVMILIYYLNVQAIFIYLNHNSLNLNLLLRLLVKTYHPVYSEFICKHSKVRAPECFTHRHRLFSAG